VEKIVAGFTAFADRTPGIEDALQTVDARVEPLYKALAVADSAGYLAFAATVREHLASLLEVARPEKPASCITAPLNATRLKASRKAVYTSRS
jgi:hypothetical protein